MIYRLTLVRVTVTNRCTGIKMNFLFEIFFFFEISPSVHGHRRFGERDFSVGGKPNPPLQISVQNVI